MIRGAYSLHNIKITLLKKGFQIKKPESVLVCGLCHLLCGQALYLGQSLCYTVDIIRVIAFSAERLRGHVGGVGLYHDAVQGHIGHDLQCAAGVFEGDVAGEGDIPAQFVHHFGVLGREGAAVEDPPGARVGTDDVQSVFMGVPVVDNGGQVQFPGQVQLGGEKVPA